MAITTLDELRDRIDRWSQSLYDPLTGGFRDGDGASPTVLTTTDVVWMRYAANVTDMDSPQRDRVVEFLRKQQDPVTGKVSHDPTNGGYDGHAFWQTLRALNILGSDIAHAPHHLKPMYTPRGLDEWFAGNIWDTLGEECAHHHEVLGLIPVVVNLGDNELTETLFRNVSAQQNSTTGGWPRSETQISRTFAYTALHMSVGMLPNMPEKVVDEILRLQESNGLWDTDIPPYFHTMDAIYILVRLPGKIGYRQEEAIDALQRASRTMRTVLESHEEELFLSTHRALAVIHAVGLLQEAFPDEYPSERPYRFDWDRLAQYESNVIRNSLA